MAPSSLRTLAYFLGFRTSARNLRLSHRCRPRFTPLTGDEAKLLLKTAQGDRLYALYAVALALGLRRGEALGLRWQDVDLVDGVIFVRQSLQRLGGKLVIGPVKSDESERVIGLPAPCLAALRQHRTSQDAERKTAGKDWKESGLVFTTTIGTPIEPRNLNRHFYRLLEFAVEWASHPYTPKGQRSARFLILFDRLQPHVVAVRYNMLSPTYGPDETDVFAFARASGTGVLIKQVLGQGLLATARHADLVSTLGPGDHRTAKPWFSPKGRCIIDAGLDPLRRHFGTGPNALAAVAIRYALQTAPDAVALIGFRTAGQISACTRDLVLDLTPNEIALVRRVGQQTRAALDKSFRPNAG